MSNESADNPNGIEMGYPDTISEVYYGGGCLPATKDELEAMPRTSRLLRTAALPNSVEWQRGNLPPAGNQGEQNSCVGWAVAYALKTYLKQVEKGWGADKPTHQFSPAFIYNQLNDHTKTNGGPISIPEAMDLVRDMGVCTLAAMPYNEKDYKTQPNTTQKEEAKQYKSQQYIPLENDIAAIKEQLYNRIPVLIRLPFWNSFNALYVNFYIVEVAEQCVELITTGTD